MDTPARLLRLLSMFTARPTWTARELTERLEVTDRTLRRDVTRLRDLGYPIVGTTGRHGGYELGAGGQLPPLVLDDDEAVAVAVALRQVSATASSSLGEAALAAAAKLHQVLPTRLRQRIEGFGEVVVGLTSTRRSPTGPLDVSTLTILAACARRAERVAFVYTDGAERTTDRRAEPHRLVSVGARWYLVAFDLDRDDWRTYRVDRIASLRATGHRNASRPTPDAAALVSEGIAVRVFDVHASIRVFAAADEVRMHIGPTVGVVQPGTAADETMVTIGGDLDWIARYLIGLPMRFEIVEPAALTDELRALARRILRQHPSATSAADSIPSQVAPG